MAESPAYVTAGVDELFVQVGASENMAQTEADDDAHGVWCMADESTKLGEAPHMAPHALASACELDKRAHVKPLQNQLMNLQRQTGKEAREVSCALERFIWRQPEDFDAGPVEGLAKRDRGWGIVNYNRAWRRCQFHVGRHKRFQSSGVVANGRQELPTLPN